MRDRRWIARGAAAKPRIIRNKQVSGERELGVTAGLSFLFSPKFQMGSDSILLIR